METRTYTERSNARRAARAAGLDPETIIAVEEGFEVRFPDRSIDPSPIKQAVEAAIERGIAPKEFVQIAEGVAEQLDTIPEFCKLSPEQRKAEWDKNPPTRAATQPKESITMPKASAKPKKKERGATGSDKTATLLKMLSGKGSTVDQMTKALDWLPHTLRARLSRLSKSKKDGGEGLKIERTREDKVTSYRIAS